MTEPGEDRDEQRRRDMPLMFIAGAIVVVVLAMIAVALINCHAPNCL